MRFKILMIVILYNKEINESGTLSSILGCEEGIGKLIIVNNGPKKIDFSKSFFEENKKSSFEIQYIEFLENKPLSSIYNKLISENEDFTYYTIFDDDTIFEVSEFINGVNVEGEKEIDVILPSIFEKSDGVKYYPLVDGSVRKESGVINECVYSISSGLTISNKLVKVFNKNNLKLFDERFVLYGVDTSFFKRLNELRKKTKINVKNSLVLHHELSRVSGLKNDFRFKERLIDEILINKIYSGNFISNVKVYIKVILKCILRGKVEWLPMMIKVILKGKHPRSEF